MGYYQGGAVTPGFLEVFRYLFVPFFLVCDCTSEGF